MAAEPTAPPVPAAAPDLAPLRDVIARFGLAAKRSLGQHFLLDGNLCARVARCAGDLGDCDVVEIGPGPGGLTRALLAAGARRVIAIERDRRCVDALAELAAAYPGRLQVIEGDALEVDASTLTAAPRRVVANLPYNVAVPLLLAWLADAERFAGLTLMFQKEVADRLCARPGGKDYGRLSVIAQWLCEARPEFNVAARAFTPPPKVTSTVVTLTPRPQPLAPAGWNALQTVTRAAFGQRRKMLRTALKGLDVDLAALGVDPTARAEELAVEQFCAIARAVSAKDTTDG